MSTRAMIDIETLGTRYDSVVTAIGAVKMNSDGEFTELYEADLNYEEDTGSMSPSTLRWWLTQDPHVLEKNLRGNVPLPVACRNLIRFMNGVDEVWANSPTFDCIILRSWFERLGEKCPWHFRAERDCRTMFAIGRRLDVPYPLNPSKHDALSDAVAQAKYLLAIEAEMARGAG